jgi:hypothetical protein
MVATLLKQCANIVVDYFNEIKIFVPMFTFSYMNKILNLIASPSLKFYLRCTDVDKCTINETREAM